MALFLRMRKSRANARLFAFLPAVAVTACLVCGVSATASEAFAVPPSFAAPKENIVPAAAVVGRATTVSSFAVIKAEKNAAPFFAATPAVSAAAPRFMPASEALSATAWKEDTVTPFHAAVPEESVAPVERIPAAPATGREAGGLFPDYILRGKLRCDTENHPKGTVVQVLEGQSDCYYLVRSADGDRMAVAWEDLTLLPPPALALPEADAADIEAEVARRGFTSGTDCLLWTCLYRLETYLLCRRDGAWRLCGRMACSAGDTAHPTPTGRYAIATKLTAIGKPDRYLCRNALCFHGAYMYHSVLLSPAGNRVLDGRLGCRISHGCIRLSEEKAAALFETVPCGTAVYIN